MKPRHAVFFVGQCDRQAHLCPVRVDRYLQSIGKASFDYVARHDPLLDLLVTSVLNSSGNIGEHAETAHRRYYLIWWWRLPILVRDEIAAPVRQLQPDCEPRA